MKSLAIYLGLILFAAEAQSQNMYLKRPIYLDVKDQYIQVINTMDSSVVTNMGTDSSRYIKVFNYKSSGHFDFIILNTKSGVAISGRYQHLDTLYARATMGRSPGNKDHQPVKKRESYYRPLRDGTWKYFDESGNLLYTEYYEKGRLK